MKDQIRRAVVSVISNIAEGFERGSKDEFLYFLYIAKGSCGEVRTQLYIALDQKFITDQDFQTTALLAKRVSAMIYGLIESLKVSGFKGLRHKKDTKELNWEEFMEKFAPETLQKFKTS